MTLFRLDASIRVEGSHSRALGDIVEHQWRAAHPDDKIIRRDIGTEPIPETTWGTHSFGLDDLRWTQVQIRYATQVLHYPVWGMSPSSTADDTGNYGGFGVEGLALPPEQRLAQCTTCATEDTVSPHASAIALPVLPGEAYANLQSLRSRYPDIYTADGGFYDAVNPKTGSLLVLLASRDADSEKPPRSEAMS